MQQSVFQKECSCADRVFTLTQTTEQEVPGGTHSSWSKNVCWLQSGYDYKHIYIHMICDVYVPAIILSHITTDNAEIKYVCVLTSVGCDFKCDISYVNGMAEIQGVRTSHQKIWNWNLELWVNTKLFLKLGKKTSKTCAVIYEEAHLNIEQVAHDWNYDNEMMRQILRQIFA